MKYIKLFEEFINEKIKFYKFKFNSHKDHNPGVDILEGHLDKDTMITYGIYIKGKKKGDEFMEYYSGENYVSGSKAKSSSKFYPAGKIPNKYKQAWLELKNKYKKEYS